MKRIITFEEWYEKEPQFATIFEKSPVLNYLYPDAALQWMGAQSPALTASVCVFEEALHKFSQRLVYIPYLCDADNYGQIMRMQADIMYQSLSEWNRWVAFKELLNTQMSQSELFKLLGNYSITKEGGWTDKYKSEKFKDENTYARETGNSYSIRNFEGTNVSPLSSTTINTKPQSTDAEPSLVHQHTPEVDGQNKHAFDGGGIEGKTNYQEFGQKMGDLWSKYKDLILRFPSAVDIFLNSTAQAYLTDVYDTNMWCNILSD